MDDLQRKAEGLPPDWREDLRFVLFSRQGFSDTLVSRAGKEGGNLIGLDELYAQGT